MAHKVLIYINPTCSTCRKAVGILDEMKVDYEKINYFSHPLSKEKWAELLKKMGKKPIEILRTKEETFTELKLDKHPFSDEALIEIMAAHPELIQRPILEIEDKAILGRPPECIKEFLRSVFNRSS
ncbi:glutaredoxin [Methylacidiphilum sp. Yel]|jgi:arsenate reductase|uniref:arsenate reductase family protein n=1 Tax=Methylacidiphilum sp. Yel TaxID=1847730 RepID=UPI001069DE20|nr:arsenate reductase family protein [Methylacidiphilum sp. Yel]TFE67249.1 glutaredoxin [Methylacidiphilum sp. Yel]